MSSSRYSPRTKLEEAVKFTVRVVTNDNKLDRANPRLSEVLELEGSWWNSAKIRNSERPPGWIWFHLQTVDKGLLSDLVQKLQTEGIIPMWERDNGKEKNGVVSFLNETFAGNKIVELPRFDTPSESGDATFSIAMDFLDSENSTTYHMPDNKMARQRLAQMDHAKNILISRSLDESFYVTANDEDDLNHDQVVFRYYKHYWAGKLSSDRTNEDDENSRKKRSANNTDGKKKSSEGIKSKILMVSPLRLWKIGHDVVITAFPASYEENADLQYTTFGNVHQPVMRSQPQNAMELVSKILASLVTIVDGPYYAGLNESLLTMFEFDTSAQMAKQLDIFKKFQDLVAARIVGPERVCGGGESQTPTALESITSEVECFRIIMDIRDELAMISSVFSEQERVIQTVIRTIEKLMKDPDANAPRDQLHEAELGIALWRKRLSNIDQRAQVVEKALGHLLNLKLEVSNLAEAEGTKKLLESSQALQAKADRQSIYLFAFTVATVIYAPLSFVTSFFAIPSRDFPQDPGGVSWNQRQIGGGLAISLVVTVGLAVLPIVLKRVVERNRDDKRKKKDDEKRKKDEGEKRKNGKERIDEAFKRMSPRTRSRERDVEALQ